MRWIAELCESFLGRSVLGIGAGQGSVTRHLPGGCERVLATDLSDRCLQALSERFATEPNVEVREADLRNLRLDESFDSIVLINVLDHIHDDEVALRTLSNHLRPGGHCLICVQALNGLYGPFDRDGHFRRYSRPRLGAVVGTAGFVPSQLRYVNILTLPAWLLLSVGPCLGVSGDDRASVGRGISVWGSPGVPLTRAIEGPALPPLGLNVFCAPIRRWHEFTGRAAEAVANEKSPACHEDHATDRNGRQLVRYWSSIAKKAAT